MADLAPDIRQELASLPESGMGFQRCKVKLKDGREFDRVIIINAEQIIAVEGHASVPFGADEVAAVELTKDHAKGRWI